MANLLKKGSGNWDVQPKEEEGENMITLLKYLNSSHLGEGKGTASIGSGRCKIISSRGG